MRVLIGFSRCPACDGSCEVRHVDGFENYAVASCGAVMSKARDGASLVLLKGGRDGKGYLCVILCRGGTRHSRRIHRLVAEAFIANPSELPCVRHLDGNPANNLASNLAWGSYAENEADKKRHGTYHRRRNNKLTESQVAFAKRLGREGLTHSAIASQMGVSRPTITRIINGRIWGDIPCAS